MILREVWSNFCLYLFKGENWKSFDSRVIDELNAIRIMGCWVLDYVCNNFVYFIRLDWFVVSSCECHFQILVGWDSKSTVTAGRAGPSIGLCGVCHVGSAGKVR